MAIVFAAQVNGRLAAGDYNGAVQTSKQAKMWCWVSFGIGLLVVVAWLGLMMMGVVAGSMAGPGPEDALVDACRSRRGAWLLAAGWALRRSGWC